MIDRCQTLGFVLLSSLLLYGCASRALTKAGVREALLTGPGLELKKDEVEIEEVSEMGQHAVVKARLRTALKYEKIGGRWVLKEVRLGDRQWENLEVIVKALHQERAQQAHRILDQHAAALEKYRQTSGHYPNVPNFERLIDQLSPQYISETVRLDPWSHPFQYHYFSPTSYRLLSPGPDGKAGTADDIVVRK